MPGGVGFPFASGSVMREHARPWRRSWWSACSAICFAACTTGPTAGTPQRQGGDILEGIRLSAGSRNAGEGGWMTLVGRDPETDVTITVSGVTPEVARPVHLYVHVHEGRCESLSDRPVQSLTDRVLPTSTGRNGPFTLRATAKATLASLRAAPHAIVVRSAPADGNLDLFCGDIPPLEGR